MKIIEAIKEAKLELRKVIFPLKEQIRNSYISVFVVVTIITLFLALIDAIMGYILGTLI